MKVIVALTLSSTLVSTKASFTDMMDHKEYITLGWCAFLEKTGKSLSHSEILLITEIYTRNEATGVYDIVCNSTMV
jgi:hypothetical protein